MKNNSFIAIVGYVFLTGALVSGAYFLWQSQSRVDEKIAEANEANRPAEITLTSITPTECPLCHTATDYTDYINKQDVRILSSETLTQDSDDGKALIEKYQIHALPAVIVAGEYDKENVQSAFDALSGETRDEKLVIEEKRPVYFDLRDQTSVGLVTMTYVTDSSCETCYDPAILRSILEQNMGVTITSASTTDIQTAEGQKLVEQYNLMQVPTAILSVEAGAYTSLVSACSSVGTIEEDGNFVLRKNDALGQVTYRDMASNELITTGTTNN